MRAPHTILALTVAVLAFSCSQPDTAPSPEDDPAPEDAPETTSSSQDPVSPFAEILASQNDGVVATSQTLADPSLETTGPVHESPGIVDHREAQVALDLLKMEDSAAKSLALTELFERWAKDDLDAAMEFFPYVENDIEPKRAFCRGVAPQLLEEDPERLLEITRKHWWQGQWEAYIKAMKKVATTNIDVAIDYYTTTEEGKQYPYLAEEIASHLTNDRSIAEAEAFAYSIERPESRGMAIRGMVKRWTRKDPAAASAYVDSLSDPDLRDHAIRGMIQQTATKDPDATLAWAKTIQPGKVRTDTVNYLSRQWSNPSYREPLEQLANIPGLSTEERALVQTALEN